MFRKVMGSLGRTEVLLISTVLISIVTCCCSASDHAKKAGNIPAALAGEQESKIPTGSPIWAAQINYRKSHSVAWRPSDFAAIAHSGINRVEINLNWGDIEPQKGKYDFQLLDRYLAGAAKANLKLYLIFWESVWQEKQGKNPPTWLSAREVASDGVAMSEPPWWGQTSRQAYFDYVAHTIDHVKGESGFGGLFANYGWLDAMWGNPGRSGSHGVAGYAPADIKEFHRWLPHTYKTLTSFNHRWHTSFSSWGQVPVPRPGDRLFGVYQQFRHYSVVQTYNELSSLVRKHTNAPMFYYWGGGIGGHGGPAVLGNDPDTFFIVAKRYHAIVVEDDANASGNTLLFGSLARSYKVPLVQEWTPSRKNDLRAETPQWLDHIGLGSPFEVGEDFFIYPPPLQRPGFADGWSAYVKWHDVLAKVINARVPEQPVAVLVPTLKIAQSPDLRAFSDLNQQLTDFWRHDHVLPHFISDQQVAEGVVSLNQFRGVIDLGHELADLPALKTYAKTHPVSSNLDKTLAWIKPYLTLDPPVDSLEVVPTVGKSRVWLTLANCDGQKGYTGSITFDPKALGLDLVTPDVWDAKTRQRLPATRVSGTKIQWRIDLPPAGLQVLRVALAEPAAESGDREGSQGNE